MCARCGCDKSCHATRREMMTRQREELAAAKAVATRVAERAARLAEAKRRAKRAEANGDFLTITNVDTISGAERLKCNGCSECVSFKCAFTTSDTSNPDVMLFCAACGCEVRLLPVRPHARVQRRSLRMFSLFSSPRRVRTRYPRIGSGVARRRRRGVARRRSARRDGETRTPAATREARAAAAARRDCWHRTR